MTVRPEVVKDWMWPRITMPAPAWRWCITEFMNILSLFVLWLPVSTEGLPIRVHHSLPNLAWSEKTWETGTGYTPGGTQIRIGPVRDGSSERNLAWLKPQRKGEAARLHLTSDSFQTGCDRGCASLSVSGFTREGCMYSSGSLCCSPLLSQQRDWAALTWGSLGDRQPG
jgi:hypothetical protein